MLALKQFRDKSRGVADLLNWSHLTDGGIVNVARPPPGGDA
jgi:hypothetical protein